ncbi:RSC9 [Candida pseudojiufengensis]|uniref:RSC9 n=1 Tax=Candida pseudojiufengensis TaxID=497109 RepID=UPI0022251EE0|nr:RSC9 [Candida pseudojiufengensis]KAI5960386.1 RSC9 [Candida pseudojiufengensis]
MPTLLPITPSSKTTIPLSNPTTQNGITQYQSIGTGFYTPYNQPPQPIGTGHPGIDVKQRIIMALKSGIQSETDWALSEVAKYSTFLIFENDSFVANELIKCMTLLYQLIKDKKYNLINQNIMRHSLDALVTLRNSAQDLQNQQWLSQVPNFKKQLTEILKFLYNWNYTAGFKILELIEFDDEFYEALIYVLDLIEPLTCYYINNSKNDVLFHTLFQILTITKDKTIFITSLKCVSHLLITWDKSDQTKEEEDDDHEEEEELNSKNITNNCIDSITEDQLQTIINTLLVADNELNYAVLYFIKMYLFSKAIYQDYSVKDSQRLRLKKLLQLNTTKINLEILLKQLPLLIVTDLPLIEPVELKLAPNTELSKRSSNSGSPTTAPELNEELYKILINFPEPARATTWLHCCYEPTLTEELEVTQISIWKAYETQFKEVWQNNENNDKIQPIYHQLLPAVDFIKNVTKAFPRAEAKVLNLNTETSEDETPKRKFIIRGIKPRQFPVSIEKGNYEAIRPLKDIETTTTKSNSELPIGHINETKFKQNLNFQFINLDKQILKNSYQLNLLNLISHKILKYIITEVLDKETSDSIHYASNLFKLHNDYWLPDLIFTNPGLLQTGIIENDWFKYLI